MPHLHHAPGSFEPVLLTLILVFAALVYLRGWLSLRALKYSSAWRACSFLAGLFLIWIAVASPLASLDHALLTVHMLQHLLLMTLAPPLIWLGDPLSPLLQGLPERLMKRVVAPEFQSPPMQKITRAVGKPEFCWLAAAAALLGWHIPPVFTLAMQSTALHFVEQASFLASGLLFWWPVVQPWPSVPRPDLSMILYLFFATIPCDILSGFLVFCDRVVYTIYIPSSDRFDFSALGDQQCAAALMWTSVTLVYFVAGGILTVQLLSRQNPRDHDFSRNHESGQPGLNIKAVPRGVPQSLEVL